jgi:hypothetical protein
MSIEIEFPLDPAPRAMEPSQIQRGRFKDSGRQIFPAALVLVIVGSVHAVLIGGYFFLKVSKNEISEISDLLRNPFSAAASSSP